MIPREQAWHVRGDPTTHWGPVCTDALYASVHYGRRLRCGAHINVRYVPGPAPGDAAECSHCTRGFR